MSVESNTAGYFLGFERIHDLEMFLSFNYPAKAEAAFRKHSGDFLAKALDLSKDAFYVENENDYYHLAVILKFPSQQKALNWYHDESYQDAKAVRLATTHGSVVVTEGKNAPADHQALVVALIKAKNKEEMSKYSPAASIAAYHGCVLFRTQTPAASEQFENEYDFAILISFPSVSMATAWMESDEYSAMKKLRLTHSSGPLAIVQTERTEKDLQ